MSSWFSGINAASSGLSAAQYGLSVVGQNMTNAATAGYTRQTVEQSAVDGSATVGLRSGSSTLGGTTVTSTTRVTDPVLDSRVRASDATASLASTSASQLSDVVTALGEPSTSGLSAQLTQFWTAWGSAANDTGNTTSAQGTRQALLTDASGLASTINTVGQSLATVTSDTAASLSSDVAAVNAAATSLATVNGAITVATATGADANSLLDQRDQLLDSLSKLSGASISIDSTGAATVSVGGQSLVSGTTATAMSVDSSNTVSVGGQAVTVGSGSIGAETTALTTTLPGYQASLDAVANRLSSVVNAAQASGSDANGNTGQPMFAGSGALGIHVVLTDQSQVVVNSSATTADGSVARTLSQTGAASGSPDALFTSLVGVAATASSVANQQSTTQASVASSVAALKNSMSGVSVNDEASQMLVYQQAFQASAKVLTAMDSMLSTLLNMGAGN